MKNRVAVLLVVSILLVAVLSACGVINDVTTVGNLGKDFMTALKAGDAEKSWGMMNESLQTDIGDKSAWVDYVKSANFSDWTFSNTQIDNNTGQIDGEATLGTDKYTLKLVFDKASGAWLLSGINFAKN